MKKVISLIDKMSSKDRLRILGLDALFKEMEIWREEAKLQHDQEFIRKTRDLIMMTTQTYCLYIDSLGEEIDKLREELANQKGGDE